MSVIFSFPKASRPGSGGPFHTSPYGSAEWKAALEASDKADQEQLQFEHEVAEVNTGWRRSVIFSSATLFVTSPTRDAHIAESHKHGTDFLAFRKAHR